LCRYDAAWRVPAVVEVLPYGAHHATVDADEATWPYLAGHGIACVRVDSRGAGNSSGVLDDEYSAQQQRDACDAVEWAARQGWCTGSVGLMGCSWGGFIALQAAALAGVNEAAATASPDCLPIQGVNASSTREAPSLKAVCAVCATDDRASDDMHWMGGALLGENLAWGAWLLDSLAQPPVCISAAAKEEEHEGDDEAAAAAAAAAAAGRLWEARWVDRLAALKPLHSEWAARHPTRGGAEAAAYWSEGSVGGRDNINTIAVPVLSVGGFNGGGYANSTPRLARILVGLYHLNPLDPQLGTAWFQSNPLT
jgi:predicted acyl esterase